MTTLTDAELAEFKALGFITFEQAALGCLENSEFMANYRKLRGSRVGLNTRSPIERMVDEACGAPPGDVSEQEWREFFEFVRDYVWHPVIVEQSRELVKASESAR